jgi:hypothetical protein
LSANEKLLQGSIDMHITVHRILGWSEEWMPCNSPSKLRKCV